MQEQTDLYIVSIKITGAPIKVRQLAHSKWEAIDRIYNEYHHKLPNVNRSKYTAKKVSYAYKEK